MAEADPDPLDTSAGWGRWHWPVWLLVAGALVSGVVLRFVTRSPLWLDEALSVNIARLPLGEIPDALRVDGHPPLYYFLLHGWMDLFGTGAVAVRSFSGLWALGLFPLMWVAARRLGGRQVATYAVALLALSPFAIRYGTETRMYAMVSVMALGLWLLISDALVRPTRARLAGIAVITGALLWSHYWALWLLAAGGIGLVVHAFRSRRQDRPDDLGASVRVIAALVAGGVLFLPWLPTLLYQGAHTGTPWARPLRPTEMVTGTLADFGGGSAAESVLLGWLIALVVGLGLFGKVDGRYEVTLDLRTRPEGRPFAIVIIGTLAIASVVGYATGATYSTRYASVFFPFVVLLAALGLDRLRSRPVAVGALAVLLLLGGIGGIRNVVTDRTDARGSVAAIEEKGEPGDWVVYCPDQLGPSTSRLLDPGFEQVTYPAFGKPQRVDWVDYKQRLADASPEDFGTELLRRARGRRIFLVYSTTYSTHKETCPEVFNAIGAERLPEQLTLLSGGPEPATVVLFTPKT